MKNQGFIAITAVLVLSAIFLSLSIGVASSAISGAMRNNGTYAQAQAKYIAEACVEYALMELSRTLNYNGDESILIGEESCEILPIAGEGNVDRVLQVQSTVREHVYRIEVVVSHISPEMELASFKSVTNF